ncbi:LacI family DNA-binding transcriptional regulator [Yersinia hibernica]|uniref:LacI family transcriptional regulator n=1 Tax=Yersinia hibernica TaxID=2339259 RepID=A0ABX5R5H3_9GAMM|nr:LacI family DNA-binding transcriptional regulator [Yersinia hibernica]QAX80906.1 LacI family transcriptional regulator [Yersinia hibernica]
MANIIDIAKKTGLSASTVSRTLTRPEKVAAATRERVMKAIDELGYEANIFARNLRQGGSQVIGLVVSDILNTFHATIVKAVQDVAYKAGYTLIVGSTDEDSLREEQLMTQLRSHMLQGLIITPTHNTRDNLQRFTNIPIVEIDRISGHVGSDTVLLNNILGVEMAARHLLELKHSRIAYIGGSSQTITFAERLAGFRQVCPEETYTDVIEIPATTSLFADACEQTHLLMSKPIAQRPTAIIAANNDIAAGVVHAIYQRNIKMPDEVSVVAFDDPDWASFFPCPLTTIRQPVYDMGKHAAELLIERLRGNISGAALSERFDPQLIVRASTARPN